jgi:hypothetical protein
MNRLRTGGYTYTLDPGVNTVPHRRRVLFDKEGFVNTSRPVL